METNTADRIRGIRELLGMTRDDFGELFNIKPARLANIEKGLAKANGEEVENITASLPELTYYVAHQGPIDYAELRRSENPLIALMLAKFDAGLAPTGYQLIECLKKPDLKVI